MPTETFYPGVGADDGEKYDAGFVSSEAYIGMGFYEVYRHGFFRFVNVTIPKGATIDSAKVRFQAYVTESGTTCNINCHFNDIDDAVAPTSSVTFAALALTSAVAWDNIPAWTADVDYDSPELKTILQGIVDRAGWNSGQAIMAVFKDNASTADRIAKAYEASTTLCARLVVEWSEPPPPIEGEISENINVLSEFDDNLGELSEDVNVSSEFDDNWPEIDENISVSSGFDALGTEKVDINLSVSTELISEHTGEFSEEASVNSEFICYQRPANLNATLPAITADIKSGALLEAYLPALIAEIAGKVDITGKLNVTFPKLIASIEGRVGTLGEIDVELPAIRASILGKTGNVATYNVTLPMILAGIQGYHDITGNIDTTLPIIAAYMIGTTERTACSILRYVEPV
ncbi:MAG: hypothetical protein Q7J15_04155 [Candidatus Desulfaltia sp.]|nr:hypothetical protein [Candidatus Desulfaltia sp.]